MTLKVTIDSVFFLVEMNRCKTTAFKCALLSLLISQCLSSSFLPHTLLLKRQADEIVPNDVVFGPVNKPTPPTVPDIVDKPVVVPPKPNPPEPIPPKHEPIPPKPEPIPKQPDDPKLVPAVPVAPIIQPTRVLDPVKAPGPTQTPEAVKKEPVKEKDGLKDINTNKPFVPTDIVDKTPTVALPPKDNTIMYACIGGGIALLFIILCLYCCLKKEKKRPAIKFMHEDHYIPPVAYPPSPVKQLERMSSNAYPNQPSSAYYPHHYDQTHQPQYTQAQYDQVAFDQQTSLSYNFPFPDNAPHNYGYQPQQPQFMYANPNTGQVMYSYADGSVEMNGNEPSVVGMGYGYDAYRNQGLQRGESGNSDPSHYPSVARDTNVPAHHDTL